MPSKDLAIGCKYVFKFSSRKKYLFFKSFLTLFILDSNNKSSLFIINQKSSYNSKIFICILHLYFPKSLNGKTQFCRLAPMDLFKLCLINVSFLRDRCRHKVKMTNSVKRKWILFFDRFMINSFASIQKKKTE